MTDGARKHVVLGGALALLGALIVALVVKVGGGGERYGGNGQSAGEGNGSAGLGRSSFTISGNAEEPITPGSSAAIDLQVTNPRWLPLVATDVQVRVREVRAPHADAAKPCSISDYAVEQVPAGTTITVPARDSRTLSGLGLPPGTWPRVSLVDRPVNQDGCKGATLVLDYSASGSIRW